MHEDKSNARSWFIFQNFVLQLQERQSRKLLAYQPNATSSVRLPSPTSQPQLGLTHYHSQMPAIQPPSFASNASSNSSVPMTDDDSFSSQVRIHQIFETFVAYPWT